MRIAWLLLLGALIPLAYAGCDSVFALCNIPYKTSGLPGDWQKECKKLICNPLCLRYTWDVKIEASGEDEIFNNHVNSPHVSNNLGAQFRAHACAKTLGCCPEDDKLWEWVENRAFASAFPEAGFPIQPCRLWADEEQRGKMCDMCKASLKVIPSLKDGACDYFPKPKTPSEAEEDESFGERGLESAGAQIPKHKSFNEKCVAMQGLLGGTIAGLASEWSEKACSCLGCCDDDPEDSCYYPTQYGNTDEALKSNGAGF
jgi:hypothetical protein